MPHSYGKPMKRSSSPRVREESVHTIYDDGTYSNDRTSVSILKKVGTEDLIKNLKKNDIMTFKTHPVSSGIVHQIVEKGVFCRPRFDYEPDISGCTFYHWGEIRELLTGVS